MLFQVDQNADLAALLIGDELDFRSWLQSPLAPRRSDELARRRQELPWVPIDKKYRDYNDSD